MEISAKCLPSTIINYNMIDLICRMRMFCFQSVLWNVWYIRRTKLTRYSPIPGTGNGMENKVASMSSNRISIWYFWRSCTSKPSSSCAATVKVRLLAAGYPITSPWSHHFLTCSRISVWNKQIAGIILILTMSNITKDVCKFIADQPVH